MGSEQAARDTVRVPYNTTSGRDCVKSLRLWLHGTCPQRGEGAGVGGEDVAEVLIRNSLPLGPYSRTMPRLLWRS